MANRRRLRALCSRLCAPSRSSGGLLLGRLGVLGGFSRLWIYISLGCLELRRDALEGGEEEPSVLVVGTPLCG